MLKNRILCIASEKGKIIVNKCFDKGISINTLKLEKLLIIIHGCTLSRYNRPFFPENIITTQQGLIIPDVDNDFKDNTNGFDQDLQELVYLLDAEDEVVNYVINKYGKFTIAQLDDVNELKALKDIVYTQGDLNLVPNTLIKGVFDYNDPRREYTRIREL